MKTKFYLIFLLHFFLVSCASDKFELPQNANKLLTSGRSKTWKLAKRYNDGYRMNMGDCFLSYRVTYNSDGTTIDNNSEHENCGESLQADWYFFSNENGAYIKLVGEKVQTLLNLDVNYKYFKIKHLSDTLMILRFSHKQYGNTARQIEDHLVPQDVYVSGRNYHN
jgi:hypothetical protein